MENWDSGILESEDYFAADEKENAEKRTGSSREQRKQSKNDDVWRRNKTLV